MAVRGFGWLYGGSGMPDNCVRLGWNGLRLALVCHFTFALRAEALQGGQIPVE
jgi:hypothetical protein